MTACGQQIDSLASHAHLQGCVGSQAEGEQRHSPMSTQQTSPLICSRARSSHTQPTEGLPQWATTQSLWPSCHPAALEAEALREPHRGGGAFVSPLPVVSQSDWLFLEGCSGRGSWKAGSGNVFGEEMGVSFWMSHGDHLKTRSVNQKVPLLEIPSTGNPEGVARQTGIPAPLGLCPLRRQEFPKPAWSTCWG